MEIQVASGEWMNEFVRRPSRRRDNRVYVPAADIIKRTIRRSWTISNPTPRWSAFHRSSPEHRPYNSLPRAGAGTTAALDITATYPSLLPHRISSSSSAKGDHQQKTFPPPASPSSAVNLSPIFLRRQTPNRRTQSEDIYEDRGVVAAPLASPKRIVVAANEGRAPAPVVRVNPLMMLGVKDKESKKRRSSPKRGDTSQEVARASSGGGEDSRSSSKEDVEERSKDLLTPETRRKLDKSCSEKRVSFDNHHELMTSSSPSEQTSSSFVDRTQSLNETKKRIRRQFGRSSFQDDHSDHSEDIGNAASSTEVRYAMREEVAPIDLCDIEPLSGTVFCKVSVRRNRGAQQSQEHRNRNRSAADNGWHRSSSIHTDSDTSVTPAGSDLILPPSCDDYRLVFVGGSSDGSSKEEDCDDSSSTASSFPPLTDECDWDYFEPGAASCPLRVITWGAGSPFGSPGESRKLHHNTSSAMTTTSSSSLTKTLLGESPLGSPIVYRRRLLDSDTGTGTDDDAIQPDDHNNSSPASSTLGMGSNSDLHHHHHPVQLHCLHSVKDTSTNTTNLTKISSSLEHQHQQQYSPCHACGCSSSSSSSLQYIPIPVPVPVPYPVPSAEWSTATSATLPTPMLQESMMLYDAARLRSLPSSFWTPSTSTTMPAVPSDYTTLMWPNTRSSLYTHLGSGARPATCDDGSVPPAPPPAPRDATLSVTAEPVGAELPDLQAAANNNKQEITGYLECEYHHHQHGDDGSDSSDSSSIVGEDELPVCRVYNVSGGGDCGGDHRHSDDALPCSSSDASSLSSSHREDDVDDDDMSSTSSGSSTDTDDTGTVADKRPKKKFSRIFVVNKNVSASSTTTDSSRRGSTDSSSSSSDNDTDTEMDCCMVVLKNVKQLSEDLHELKGAEDDQEGCDSDKESPCIEETTTTTTEYDNASENTSDGIKLTKYVCNRSSGDETNTDDEIIKKKPKRNFQKREKSSMEIVKLIDSKLIVDSKLSDENNETKNTQDDDVVVFVDFHADNQSEQCGTNDEQIIRGVIENEISIENLRLSNSDPYAADENEQDSKKCENNHSKKSGDEINPRETSPKRHVNLLDILKTDQIENNVASPAADTHLSEVLVTGNEEECLREKLTKLLTSNKDNDYMSSSPGLSDVSAESLSSSDIECRLDDEELIPPTLKSDNNNPENKHEEYSLNNENATTLNSDSYPDNHTNIRVDKKKSQHLKSSVLASYEGNNTKMSSNALACAEESAVENMSSSYFSSREDENIAELRVSAEEQENPMEKVSTITLEGCVEKESSSVTRISPMNLEMHLVASSPSGQGEAMEMTSKISVSVEENNEDKSAVIEDSRALQSTILAVEEKDAEVKASSTGVGVDKKIEASPENLENLATEMTSSFSALVQEIIAEKSMSSYPSSVEDDGKAQVSTEEQRKPMEKAPTVNLEGVVEKKTGMVKETSPGNNYTEMISMTTSRSSKEKTTEMTSSFSALVEEIVTEKTTSREDDGRSESIISTEEQGNPMEKVSTITHEGDVKKMTEMVEEANSTMKKHSNDESATEMMATTTTSTRLAVIGEGNKCLKVVTPIRDGSVTEDARPTVTEEPEADEERDSTIAPPPRGDDRRPRCSSSSACSKRNAPDAIEPSTAEGSTSISSDTLRLPQPGVVRASAPTTTSTIATVDAGNVGSAVDVNKCNNNAAAAATRYTSLVMITQEPPPSGATTSCYQQVSVITTDTTRLVGGGVASGAGGDHNVVVRHTNWQEEAARRIVSSDIIDEEEVEEDDNDNHEDGDSNKNRNAAVAAESVTVITGGETLSAFEEGLADDDSWVENLSNDDDDDDDEELDDDFGTTNSASDDSSSGEEVTLTCSAAIDQEDELRGYHRAAIDFTLHTIVEESCEESEYEHNQVVRRKERPASATDLEKYFFFGLGDGAGVPSNKEDAFSETSSIYSEGMESLGTEDNSNQQQNQIDSCCEPAEMASSRLEKYFLSGFMGFTSSGRRDSDGSVGSDSEGKPSPEQRRKRLVRARGTGRSHSSSLDNLDSAGNNSEQSTTITNDNLQMNSSADSSSSDSDTYDDLVTPNNTFEKNDGQFDTVKRKKNKKQKNPSSPGDDNSSKNLEATQELDENEDDSHDNDEDRNKTPQPEMPLPSNLTTNKNQQSRDSGFIGSCDDLIKEQRDSTITESSAAAAAKNDTKIELEHIAEEKKISDERKNHLTSTTPPATSLTRKDSFNNWSSDEETNLMMSKMRQFFKTMVGNSSKPPTPSLGTRMSSSPKPLPSPKSSSSSSSTRIRCKPPQLVYFENELTRLMKTVPGLRDDQVRELVEYLSSEDTWSDSYDSSDYTSSDLEGASSKSALQQEISDSCKQIINKFDTNTNATVDDEGDEGDGGIYDTNNHQQGLNRETAFVYQKLVASFEKMATGDAAGAAALDGSKVPKLTPQNSPQLIAKVMHHIGSRLVALMHEVSSGESHTSNSPRAKHYHRRLQHKISSASSTTTEDDCPENNHFLGMEDSVKAALLPRSRSHDLLLGENRTTPSNPSSSSSSGAIVVSDSVEEREVSDCERFSWRGSFESALIATTDSRNKLSSLGGGDSCSASSVMVAAAAAAKRRSAGDLLFSHKSMSREQLDRVRSCGSIGGANSEDKMMWVVTSAASQARPTRRRSSVPDAVSCGSGGSADGEEEEEEEDDDDFDKRSTLPRSLQSVSGAQSTNSLPRLPTMSNSSSGGGGGGATVSGGGVMQKSQSMYHFLPQNVKSARYRPPGFSRLLPPAISVPQRAVSAPGLQPSHQRRGAAGGGGGGRRSQQHNVPIDDVSISEAHSSPTLASRSGGGGGGGGGAGAGSSKSATPSPVAHSSRRTNNSATANANLPTTITSHEWHGGGNDDDIDRLVGLHGRTSLSSLGLRSDSMASVYSGAGGEGRYGAVTVRGQVEFGLQYNYKAGALEVHVCRCKDLAAVDAKRGRSDPYVKAYLLPDRSKGGKRKTKVKKHTLNPVFDECLRFHISLNGLESRTLWLTVWHSDMFGRNDFLGEVMMTLEDKVFDDPTPKWYNLQERSEPFEDVQSFKGDIIVCLKFVPPDMTVQKKGKRSRGALHVLVKEAKSLTAVKANGTSDPFCKSYLLPDKGRSSKQKTPIARRTVNPIWNYTFVYDDVTLQELAERSLELTVWDHDRLASNEFLGGVRFSLGTGKHYGKSVDWMDATGKELNLWKSMLERPNFWVEGCLSLRPTLDARPS